MTPERYARIKQIFAHAIELDEQQRDAYLARECGNDPELRSEVESLLEHDDSQTIIRTGDETVADFSRRTVVASPTRTLVTRLRGLGSLTKHLESRGYLALGGLAALILLSLLGYLGQQSIDSVQRELRREALNEIVDSKVIGLRMWLEHETEKAESWARSNQLRGLVGELVRVASETDELHSSLRQSPLLPQLKKEIAALAGGEEHFCIWDRRHLMIADSITDGGRIGRSATPWGSSLLASVFEGKSQPFAFNHNQSVTKLDEATQVKPHLAIVTPIRDQDGAIIAALQIHDDDSREETSRILKMFQLGSSGDTYIFNRTGLLLSAGRFDQQLLEIASMSEGSSSEPVDEVYLRDPGGDLTVGYQLDEPLSTKPLTRMARMCVAGQDGDDLDGYRDYRGVQVVGAWRWLDDLNVGVATELDVNQAEPGTRVMVWESWLVFGLFALCMGITLYSYYSVHRLRQDLGENRKLGQYRLVKQIGEGGMGKVFKAQHELLRRPTAIKLLRPELMDRDSLARFEREAQLVSQLEHFNTIRVFDYGVTPEGIFYLVMEYIDGLTLDELVELSGPLTPARTVCLLQQICYSLREAHDAALVHRDLKPGNIMVCQRGGESDVVKVLDFGLVKPLAATPSQEITSTDLIAGTPQYMPPERLSDPDTNDPRSDLYSLGAVAHFLLSGRNAVQGSSLAEILYNVVHTPPQRASERATSEIPPALDDLVYRCLSKDPNQRPLSAREMLAELQQIEASCPWTPSQAEAWWAETDHLRKRG